MDLCPYLEWFNDYIGGNGRTNYPELNDIDLQVKISHKNDLFDLFNILNTNLTYLYDNRNLISLKGLLKENGCDFDFNDDELEYVIKRMSFGIVYNVNLKTYVIKGAVNYFKSEIGMVEDGKPFRDVFTDINPLLITGGPSRGVGVSMPKTVLLPGTKFSIKNKDTFIKEKQMLLPKHPTNPPPTGLGFVNEEFASIKKANWTTQIELLNGKSFPEIDVDFQQKNRVYAMTVLLFALNYSQYTFNITGGFLAHLYTRSEKLNQNAGPMSENTMGEKQSCGPMPENETSRPTWASIAATKDRKNGGIKRRRKKTTKKLRRRR
jgi:hypothetical protein